MKLIHSAIRTKDLQKSVDFYTNLFGFTVREKRRVETHNVTLVFLRSKETGSEIEIIAEDNPEKAVFKENGTQNSGCGFAHFAFISEDIDSDAALLKQKGASFSREPFYSLDKSMKIAFLNDPDGIMIELIQFLNK